MRGHNGPKNRQPASGTHHKASISDGGSASRQKGGDGSLDSKEGNRVLVAMTLVRLDYSTSRSIIQIVHAQKSKPSVAERATSSRGSFVKNRRLPPNGLRPLALQRSD